MSHPISSLYLHFPFCQHLCNYCDFYKKVLDKQKNELSLFHENLLQSALLVSELNKKNNFSLAPLETLYLGGGTPSLWGQSGTEFLDSFFKKINLSFSDELEFTMESNPGSLTREDLSLWRKLGVNRFSVGIQSFDEHYLPLLDRVHSLEESKKILTLLKNQQMNFSVDLMIGLPEIKGQKRDVLREVEQLMEYNPSHFSVYILTVKNNFPHIKEIPDDEAVSEEYLRVCSFLELHGYEQYEVSNFAKKDRFSRHNYRYWDLSPVMSIGPSAVGFLPLSEEKALRYRVDNSALKLTEEFIEGESLELERIYLKLRTQSGLLLSDFSQSVQKEVKALFESWERDSYAVYEREKGHLKLRSKGYIISDFLLQKLLEVAKK